MYVDILSGGKSTLMEYLNMRMEGDHAQPAFGHVTCDLTKDQGVQRASTSLAALPSQHCALQASRQ